MKKIFSLFLATVIVVVFVPAIVIFVFDFGEKEAKTANNERKISVLKDGSVSECNMEEYLFGVLAAEMPAAFHKEALKAQAVAARTYIINKSQNGDDDHPAAAVCTDSTHCKAYMTEKEINEKFGSSWYDEYADKVTAAIAETKDEVAVYEGEPIEAVFHSTGSGMTENAKDVWGGDVPYLVSVESPGDMLSPVFLNDVQVDFDSFKAKILEESGINAAAYIGEIKRNASGSVSSADLGGAKFEGVKVREMFSLPSANFTVTADENCFTFHCKGKGHGVGMSQYGAEYFANNGMNYKDILKTYYKGIEVINIGENNDENT